MRFGFQWRLKASTLRMAGTKAPGGPIPISVFSQSRFWKGLMNLQIQRIGEPMLLGRMGQQRGDLTSRQSLLLKFA
jgi:hypothetical protein